jgi:nitrate/nitrite transport system ATP-binding protein
MILQVNNIRKAYGSREVLRDISLEVTEGELVCIVGYSGAGKTTLINLIAGLLQPDSGEILFDGRPTDGPSLERSLIFQNYSLLPWLNALSNVELAVAQCLPQATKAEVSARARRYLEMVKLSHALDRRPAELSGGMRQRVSLARGLAMEPKLLLLDEPLSALDALTRAELQEELMRIQQQEKRTILMITNDVDEAIMLADRIIPMSAGPAATLGSPVRVQLRRPCDRRQLNADPNYQHARKTILNYLLSHGPGHASSKASAIPREIPQYAGLELSRAEEVA